MNKKLLTVVIIIIIVIGGSIAYLMMQEDEDPSESSQSTTPISNQTSEPEPATDAEETAPAPSVSSGQYVDYDEALLASTPGTKVIFFHAPWCPQCRALEADILAKGVPEGVTIFKLDYDTNQALRQKYGVTLQTTLVKVDDQGNEIEKYVSYDEPTLEAVKRNLLD